MDVHKPNPIHSWRDFAKEVGIIVLGVLIALTAEQAVEALHWRHKIAEAEAAMRLELGSDDLPQAYVRAAIAPCLEARLKAMRQALVPGVRGETLAPLIDDYNVPSYIWDSDAWKVAVASDIGAHMAPERLLRWSTGYVIVPLLAQGADQERQARARLNRSRFKTGVLSPAAIETLSDTIDELASINRPMGAATPVLIDNIAALGLKLTPARKAELLAMARAAYGDCAIEPVSFIKTPAPNAQIAARRRLTFAGQEGRK